MAEVYRAPMRARSRDDVPEGAGADWAIARGLVGTGDVLPEVPSGLAEAVLAATSEHGEKAGRMLSRFAALEDGAFVWTRTSDERFHLGRIAGPWRYDDSAEARAVGIHHVRPAEWLERSFTLSEIPAAVAATFARGGRNFQRTHDTDAERRTAALWEAAT